MKPGCQLSHQFYPSLVKTTKHIFTVTNFALAHLVWNVKTALASPSWLEKERKNLPQMKPGMLKTDRKIRRTEAVLVPHQTWTLPWRTEEAVTGIRRFVV